MKYILILIAYSLVLQSCVSNSINKLQNLKKEKIYIEEFANYVVKNHEKERTSDCNKTENTIKDSSYIVNTFFNIQQPYEFTICIRGENGNDCCKGFAKIYDVFKLSKDSTSIIKKSIIEKSTFYLNILRNNKLEKIKMQYGLVEINTVLENRTYVRAVLINNVNNNDIINLSALIFY